MEKLYYTIGEVASTLGENVSLVRFWAETFSQFIKPKTNAKGNRLFTKEHLETYKKIHYLVKVKGYKLEGVAKCLSGEQRADRDEQKVLETLKAIREQLLEISSTI